ncbi:MAG: hypothetical protein GYA55_04030 [SAR324 cluster bacterium]|uniref:Uncharacterized protein n=1 Tax=SAR324 cluster bacterium TaxID=2024889 RepID=A0A7X9FQD2_9DELT|nr:hypothetical protein [SAR324 cluster bacterium]
MEKKVVELASLKKSEARVVRNLMEDRANLQLQEKDIKANLSKNSEALKDYLINTLHVDSVVDPSLGVVTIAEGRITTKFSVETLKLELKTWGMSEWKVEEIIKVCTETKIGEPYITFKAKNGE